jgi:hypothetical protein
MKPGWRPSDPGGDHDQQPANAPLNCCTFGRVRVALMPVILSPSKPFGNEVCKASAIKRAPQTGNSKQHTQPGTQAVSSPCANDHQRLPVHITDSCRPVQISSIDDAHECDSLTATASPLQLHVLSPPLGKHSRREQHHEPRNSILTQSTLPAPGRQCMAGQQQHATVQRLSRTHTNPHILLQQWATTCPVWRLHAHVWVAHARAMTSPRTNAAKQAAPGVPDPQTAAMCPTFSQVYARAARSCGRFIHRLPTHPTTPPVGTLLGQ